MLINLQYVVFGSLSLQKEGYHTSLMCFYPITLNLVQCPRFQISDAQAEYLPIHKIRVLIVRSMLFASSSSVRDSGDPYSDQPITTARIITTTLIELIVIVLPYQPFLVWHKDATLRAPVSLQHTNPNNLDAVSLTSITVLRFETVRIFTEDLCG